MEVLYWSAPSRRGDKHNVISDKQVALQMLQLILEDTTDPLFRGHLYKIGITGDPMLRSYGHKGVVVDERTAEHDPSITYVVVQKGLWARMHVIYSTMVQADIRQMERDFVQFATARYGGANRDAQKKGQCVFPFNTSPGGGGPLPSRGPYYLYVLQSAA